MTREEADQECARLRARSSGEAQWFPRQRADDDWEIVKVRLPPGADMGKVTPEVQAAARPETPDDPRPQHRPEWGF
jgi:hypothetical protein